jgi:hypothetical protein
MTSSPIIKATASVENALDSLGIGIYDPPLRRFGVVASGTALLVWTFKPKALFDEQGKPRPMSLTGDNLQGTPIPWWTLSLLVGGLSILFI